MASTYTAIQKLETTNNTTAAISFTSIPNTYTDLVIWYSLKGTAVTPYQYVKLTFNSSTATNYQHYVFYGLEATGTARASNKQTTNASIYDFFISGDDSDRTSTYGSGQIYIPRYAGSTKKKTSIDFGSAANRGSGTNVGGTGVILGYHAGMWNLTDAITSITLTIESGNFKQYSTATLYGIKKS